MTLAEESDGTDIVRYAYQGDYVSTKALGAGESGVVQRPSKTTADLDHFDAFGRPIVWQYKKTSDSTDQVLLRYNYDYASDITWRYDDKMQTAHAKNWSQRYTYDTLVRLTQAQQGAIGGTLSLGPPPSIGSPSRRQDWDDYGGTQLDDLGNWVNFNDDGTADARTHNTANEIESRTYGAQPRTVSYDVAGNLETLQESASNAGWQFAYDYRNRLIMVEHTDDLTELPEPDWTLTAEYFYDAGNRRIKKDLTTGNDVVYLYDGWQCAEEREVDGGTWEMRRQYVYGGQYIDEPVLFDKDTDDDEDIDVSYWYLHDTNYNVVAVADNAGSTVERCWYEPYGPTTFTNASGTANTPATESDFANTLAFQGQRYDSESGLYYLRNRYYSPVLGRFAQRDPAGHRGGPNLYVFVGGRAVGPTDPFGYGPFEQHLDCLLTFRMHDLAREIEAGEHKKVLLSGGAGARDQLSQDAAADATLEAAVAVSAEPAQLLLKELSMVAVKTFVPYLAEAGFPEQLLGSIKPKQIMKSIELGEKLGRAIANSKGDVAVILTSLADAAVAATGALASDESTAVIDQAKRVTGVASRLAQERLSKEPLVGRETAGMFSTANGYVTFVPQTGMILINIRKSSDDPNCCCTGRNCGAFCSYDVTSLHRSGPTLSCQL